MGYPARIEIMGAPIDPYTMEQTVSRTKDFVETGVFAHLAGVNVFSTVSVDKIGVMISTK